MDDLRSEMEMSKKERDSLLENRDAGVLSLADGSDSYSIPVSYGYSPEGDGVVYLMLGYGPESKKEKWIEKSETVCFVVFEMDEDAEARSVVIQGSLEGISDDGEVDAYAALADNATFTALHESGTSVERTEYALYRINPKSITARKFERQTVINKRQEHNEKETEISG